MSGESLGQYRMPVGKWNGVPFSEIHLKDPGYLGFVANLSPDPDSGHASLWLEAREMAKAFLATRDSLTPTSQTPAEYHRDPQASIICLGCQQLRDFSDVLMLTASVIAIKCSCQATPIRTNKNHPRFEALREVLLRHWEGVAIPYVAAEYSSLPCPAVDHKWNRFTLVMSTVDDSETFLARCAADDARSLPMSSDDDG